MYLLKIIDSYEIKTKEKKIECEKKFDLQKALLLVGLIQFFFVSGPEHFNYIIDKNYIVPLFISTTVYYYVNFINFVSQVNFDSSLYSNGFFIFAQFLSILSNVGIKLFIAGNNQMLAK